MAGVISEGDVLWQNPEGTARVTVQVDVDPGPPEDDGAMPTLAITVGRYDDQTVVEQVTGSPRYGFDAPAVWSRFDQSHPGYRQTLEVFTRWLRIYRGTTTVWEHDAGRWPDPAYLTFDTAAWREDTGVADNARGTAREDFAEYEAYLSNDVWGLQLEHKVRREIKTTDLADPAVPLEWTRKEEWVTHDSVWGVYGSDRDWALQLAAEHFDITEEATA